MEAQPRRLWRKIGLEKNFLQGTSHSDQSKNSQLEQSFANSESSSQSQAKNKSFMKTKTPFQQVQISNNHLKVNVQARKSLNVSVQSCETPINKLLGQYEAESKYTLWQQSDNDFAHTEPHSDKNAGINTRRNSSGVSIVLSNSTINQNNMSVMIQNIVKQNNKKDTANDNKSSRKEIFKVEDSVVMSEQRFGEVREIAYQGSKEDLRIRLVGVNDEGKNQMESVEVRQVRQLRELVLMKQTRIKQLQCQLNTLLKQTLPSLSLKSSQLTHQHSLFKQSLLQSLSSLHNQLSHLISKQFHQQISQLSDQIGYLYSQNEQLINKMQGKENMIKKLTEENGLVRKRLEEQQASNRLEIQEGKEGIVRLHNKIYSLEEKLEDLEEMQAQKETLTDKINSLQAQILSINSRSKQSQLLLHQQITSISTQLSAKQFRTSQLQLQLSQLKSQSIYKQQQLQLQIARLVETNHSLQQQLAKTKKQLQSTEEVDLLKSQLQKQRKQMLAIKQQQKEQVFMRELLETLLGESLSHNPIQVVTKIEKQYSIKSYDFLNTMFAFIKEQIYHNTNTNPNGNTNNNSNQSNNNNNINDNNNNSNNSPSGLRIQGFGANNDSSKNLLRKTGYFGQVAGSRKLLNVRLDDIQKNYSTQILEQSQNGNDDQQHVHFQQLQRNKIMSPRQKNQLTYSHMRQQSGQQKRLHTVGSNPYALTQRYSSSKDISQDLQIVKSGLRLELGEHCRSGRNSELIESQDHYHCNQANNKQLMGACSNPDYSFSEQNNMNQPSFYKKEFDFGDQSFMNDQNQDEYKRQMGSFTDRNKSCSSNTLMLNDNKRNSIIISNKLFYEQQTNKIRNLNNYNKNQQQQSSSYYDRKSVAVDRNNDEGTNKTQRDDIIEKIRQRVRQKFGDSSRSKSKSKSKPQTQHQQALTNHQQLPPNLKLNFTNLNNKQSSYNKHNRHQTSMISINQPTYNTTSMSLLPKTSRPSLYSHQHENDTGSRLLLGVSRKEENLYGNANTKSNANVLSDFFDRHKNVNTAIQYQSMKTEDQRITSPTGRLPVRSPTNIRPRSPSSSSTVAAKVNSKYTPVGYGLMANSNKSSVTIGPTVRSSFSRSTIQKPDFNPYTRKTPQSSIPHPTTYQQKSPSYSISGRQHVSSFSKKY